MHEYGSAALRNCNICFTLATDISLKRSLKKLYAVKPAREGTVTFNKSFRISRRRKLAAKLIKFQTTCAKPRPQSINCATE